VDIVLVGLPGSGKSAVGKRLANRHDAAFIDLDAQVEQTDGRAIPRIFEEDGEAAFRSLERSAIASLGPADESEGVRRVIATGGGAVVDPRNRWDLYHGRLSVWLDGRPEVLAQRLRRSPNVRPLITGRDPIGAIRDLAARRERFYAAADLRLTGVADVSTVVAAVEADLRTATPVDGTVLLRAATPIGQLTLGHGIAAAGIDEALRRCGTDRAVLVSEPGAWSAVGETVAAALRSRGWDVSVVLLPEGEAAKRLRVIETAAGELSRLRLERHEPLVAIGGGALGDAAGFLAATYLRGVPVIHVPTTLVAQIDSSIGGKTAVDLPEGKNLVGAFHQPLAIVADVAVTQSLPVRHRRAALGEAVKMAVLGDERLFSLLEDQGPAVAEGTAEVYQDGVVAELVERSAWAKMEVVMADEREQGATGGRITLNLGHSLGHAVEAAAGYGDVLHGEAIAYGLRAACAIGLAFDVTPPERAARILGLLDRLELGRDPLPYRLDAVLEHLAVDKKHRSGRLRWVLPTSGGVEVRSDIDEEVVRTAASAMLGAGQPA
jgi:shikimate kinase/3-dehydroquinate synthase